MSDDAEAMNERRVLAVTGASAGIGFALALRAANTGYAIVAIGRNREALAALEVRVRERGGTIVTLVADVRSSTTSQQIAEAALEHYGRLDVVVANAGIAGRGPLAIQTDDELLEQLETHVMAPITLIRACLPLLMASKGAVFVLGSGVARMPIGGMGLYPASKAALRSASRTLRTELRPAGVDLTYVDPGAVDTEFMHRRSMPGAPAVLLTSPYTVADRILRGIGKGYAELNVVGWQSALLGIAELFPRLTDAMLARAGSLTGAPLLQLDMSRNIAVQRLREDPSVVAMTETGGLEPANDDSIQLTAEDAPKSIAEDVFALEVLCQKPHDLQPAIEDGTEISSGNDDRTTTASSVTARLISARSPKLDPDDDPLSLAFTPFVQRMRRLNFSAELLRARVSDMRAFSEDEIALDWVGMPNKNERKLISDLCQACALAGILHADGERRWSVLPTPSEQISD